MTPGRWSRRTGPREVALTGTPGTGKSSVGEALSGRFEVVEVADLALGRGLGRPISGGVEVDLTRLARRWRPPGPGAAPRVVVGHLSHLLPIREVVVLRCHPVELDRRLTRARRGSVRDRRANVESEALDVVLLEALDLGRRVHEVDTTARTPASVARSVARLLASGGPPRFGRTDWLADPSVTDYLLRGTR